MMPPTPSMNRMPLSRVDRGAAERDQLVEVDAAAFARGGEIGRQRRAEAPGRDALDFVGRDRPPERGEQHRRIAGLDHGGIVAAHHRLERVRPLWPALAQIADQPGGDEGLADIGAGRGDEIGGHDSVPPRSCRARVAASRAIWSSGCCAVKVRRRRAVPAGTVGGRMAAARKPSSASRREAASVACFLADDHRHDRALRSGRPAALREGFRLLHRQRGIARLALDQVERGDGGGDASPAAGRSNRSSVRARLRIRSITGAEAQR